MRILAITTIRSDYDLMSGLYFALHNDPDIDFKLLVAGTHLSPTYGLTVHQIEQDGFNILAKSETLLDSDSHVGRLKSAAIMLLSVVDIVAQYNPDLLLYTGDREDVMIGALLGAYLNIPTMHFFSGDHAADGHVDNPVRHATSKLTTFHCASIEKHAERLRALGEPNERISVIGSIALDKFVAHKAMSTAEIFSQLSIEKKAQKIALVIFHPVDAEKEYSPQILIDIITALQNNNIFAFVGAPNSDPNNRQLLDVHEKYKGMGNVYFYKSMPRDIFLSIFKQSELIIGNSSAGILEAASVPIPAVNVGARQVGRLASKNVIFCDTDTRSISSAVLKALSTDFKHKTSKVKNPYGDGDSVKNAIKVIKSRDFKKLLYKKEDPLYVNKGTEKG